MVWSTVDTSRIMTSLDDEINNNVVGISSQFANNDRPSQCTYNNSNGNVMCLSHEQLNTDVVPISALSSKSKDVLSKQLNPLKVIPSENGLSRDWRGFLQFATNRNDHNISKTDPMKEVLKIWLDNDKNATLGQLVNILQNIDRWDVIDDARECFLEDSRKFFRQSEVISTPEVKIPKTLTSGKYKAFILFADEDIDFALEIIKFLELKNLNVYVKERDMPIGAYENDEIIQQIRNHCEHMIVILSKSFSNSRVNEFFLKYAQWNGIAQNKRKVIPLVYEDCDIPQTLEHCALLFWKRRKTPFFDFWGKLYQSLLIDELPYEVPRIMITEAENDNQSLADSEQSSEGSSTIHSYLEQQVPEKPQRKTKRKTKLSSSLSPSSTGFKKLLSNIKKIGSQTSISTSMWALGPNDRSLDKNNKRSHSSLSLSTTTPTQFPNERKKFGIKFLSPNKAYRSAESDSSAGTINSDKQKKKWYRKRLFHGKSRDDFEVVQVQVK